jgi:peptidoglycan-N-acetylglucosamine deacetylase
VPGSLLNILFVGAVGLMVAYGLFTTVLALVRARGRRRIRVGSGEGVSVLIAAFNEEAVIGRTIKRVLDSTYPLTEVVVVDDGSTDGTAAEVRAIATRDSRVLLVQQPNSGKWAALNQGLSVVREEIVVTIDADTVVTPDAVGHLAAAFTSPAIGAVAGVVKVGNHGRNLLTRWQALEYITQIGVERAASAFLGAVMVVPGACSAWRRTAVLQAGGYSNATLAEDCDLTLMLHRHGWRVEQADDAVAFTEAPETLDALLRQRVRWMFGTLQALWRHGDMVFRPRYGWLGMLFLPMAVITLVLPLLFTPLVALALLQLLADDAAVRILLYLGLFAAVYGLVAFVAVRLLHERLAHLVIVPIYRLIYEPLRAYLLYASLGSALRGVRMGWHKLDRTANLDGVQPVTPPRAVPVVAERPLEVAS